MIHDCMRGDRVFGIVSSLNGEIKYGTTVLLKSINKVYNDGRMDIQVVGQRVFEVEEFEQVKHSREYPAGLIHYLPNDMVVKEDQVMELKEQITEFFQALEMVGRVGFNQQPQAFGIGHYLGLSIDQKYALLQLQQETERQEFLIHHLRETIPVARQFNESKRRIKMNGHYKYFDLGDDFRPNEGQHEN